MGHSERGTSVSLIGAAKKYSVVSRSSYKSRYIRWGGRARARARARSCVFPARFLSMKSIG